VSDFHRECDVANIRAREARPMLAAAPQLVPPPDDGAAARVRARVAVLEQALVDEVVTFHDVAGAWFELCDDAAGPAERARLEKLYPQLRAAWEGPRGGVITAYFCERVRIAAALTDIRTAAGLNEGLPKQAGQRSRSDASSSAIHLELLDGDPDDPKAKALLYRCLELHYRALEFLAPKPRKICLRALFAIIAAVLGRLDAGGEAKREYTCLEGELGRVEAYYRRSSERQARLTYLAGMGAISLLATAAAAFPVALDEPLAAAALAGSAGGIVSVLMRMGRGQLSLNGELGETTLWVLGAGRVLLGALLGAAVYVLLKGHIIPTPAGQAGNLFFYAGAAFVAGFTERLMGDADQPSSSRGSSRMSSNTTVSGPAS
jgi:hypothetical protein